MIIGVGTDIVEIERIKKRIANTDFVKLVFTPVEIDYCKSKSRSAEHYAARFAAKEAFFKAIGTGVTGKLEFLQVEITNSPEGTPRINIFDDALLIAKKAGVVNIHLSISHESKYAVATVILEK
jgi:holo-[acyl-carrier protein] synthase